MLESRLMEGAYYVIRRMEYEDIAEVAQIDREAFPGEWVFRSQSAYKRDLDNPSVRYIVASIRGAAAESPGEGPTRASWFKRRFGHERGVSASPSIAGFSGFWMMMREAHIISIGVREGYRRSGIGEGLLIATVELAQISNADVVTLEVRASNEIAQGLYRKYGFRLVGRRPRYYSSNGEDAIIMSTDSISSVAFQADFQQLREGHARRHPELLMQVR
ncbi:MAG: ribosomal protein S18-alanine N-acetyltransferase [Dehalococcoidia bacterium]